MKYFSFALAYGLWAPNSIYHAFDFNLQQQQQEPSYDDLTDAPYEDCLTASAAVPSPQSPRSPPSSQERLLSTLLSLQGKASVG